MHASKNLDLLSFSLLALSYVSLLFVSCPGLAYASTCFCLLKLDRCFKTPDIYSEKPRASLQLLGTWRLAGPSCCHFECAQWKWNTVRRNRYILSALTWCEDNFQSSECNQEVIRRFWNRRQISIQRPRIAWHQPCEHLKGTPTYCANIPRYLSTPRVLQNHPAVYQPCTNFAEIALNAFLPTLCEAAIKMLYIYIYPN